MTAPSLKTQHKAMPEMKSENNTYDVSPNIKPRKDPRGGLNIITKLPAGLNPAEDIRHGPLDQTERAFSAGSTFLSGILAISASQLIGAPLKLADPKFYDGYMAWTKESFAVLVTTMTQWWSPTAVRVTGDASMKDQLFQMPDGSLKCNFPHRLVLMANHQLYTDWLYLWWIAYTNKMHGRIYIILKESLKQIPILGWAAQFYNFIFLSRKWDTDRPRFRRALRQLSNAADPMWLLIFPEGTNLSEVTREKSRAWAAKQGIPDLKHQLLPRSTGLQFCLQELAASTNWLYDCTIAYEGVPAGQYGQDIFTLRSSLFEGRPPKSVNMYWRRFRISDIPVGNADAFGMWLRNRWTEKDYLLEHFHRRGAFPEGDPVAAMQREAALQKFAETHKRLTGDAKTTMKPVAKFAKSITTEVKAGGWEEFLGIFKPLVSAANALSKGDIRPDSIGFDALLSKMVQHQQQQIKSLSPASKSLMVRLANQARMASLSKLKRSGLTADKDLDPRERKAIEEAHTTTRRKSEEAFAPLAARGPHLQKNRVPTMPRKTIVTRPVSTITVQRARQAVPSAAVPKGVAEKKDALIKGTRAEKVSMPAGKAAAAHPLAGRKVDRATLAKMKDFRPVDQASTEDFKQA